MKNIHFVIEHCVYLFFYWSDWQEVPWRVDKDSSPFVLRFVIDTDRDTVYEKFVVLILLEDLGIGLQSTQETTILLSSELPSSILSDKKRVRFLGRRERKVNWATRHVDVQSDIRLPFGSAFEDMLKIVVDSLYQDRDGWCYEIPDITGWNRQRSSFGIDGEFLGQRPELG